MARKLIVLFDGTWNNNKNRTNVIRMREAIASSGPDDRPAWSRTRNRTWISHKLSARLDLRSPVIAPSSVARGG